MSLITISLVSLATALFAMPSVSAAESRPTIEAGSILPGCWTEFDATRGGSLAWAGENETFSGVSLPEFDSGDDMSTDIALVTGIAAPEPPALVLAGMAIGGVVCGRSLLRKRQSTPNPAEDRS